MKHATKIEWTHIPGFKGETWNPFIGCSKVSAGCKYCYAERFFPRAYPGQKFNNVNVRREIFDKPLHWEKPRAVFVNSMSDFFHEEIPDDAIVDLLLTMLKADRHIFMVLTKRPARAVEFFDRTDWELFAKRLYDEDIDAAKRALARQKMGAGLFRNVWMGVSIEDQDTADERIPLLLQLGGSVKFISYEPALGPVDFECVPWPSNWDRGIDDISDGIDPLRYSGKNGSGVDWVIAGGESGPRSRPSHPDWYRHARDQCLAADVPFYFKQWGNWAPHPYPPARGKNTGAGIFLKPDGTKGCQGDFWDGQAEAMDRHKSKAIAGDLLDFERWHQFPQVKI